MLKVKVPNQFYNGKIGVLEFTKGVAEVGTKEVEEAKRIAIMNGFEVIEEKPKKTTTRKPATTTKK